MRTNRMPPTFLPVVDDEGRRFVIRTSAIQFLADGDAFQDTTIIAVAGRPICIPRPLDDICKDLGALAKPEQSVAP